MSKIRQIGSHEFKSLNEAVIKDVDVKNGIVTGYYAKFGNVDSHKDMIMPGAFKKTIAERGPNGSNQIFHLLQHDPMTPLGKPKTLIEDSFGLYFETEIVTTEKGIETLKLYEAGVYNEHSIGFRTIKYNYVENPSNPDEYHWELTELKLYEGSTVTWGANDQTPFTGFKSKDAAIDFLSKRKEKLITALKIGSLTDDTLCQIEMELNQIFDQLKNIHSLHENRNPDPAANSESEAGEKSSIDPKDAEKIIVESFKNLLS